MHVKPYIPQHAQKLFLSLDPNIRPRTLVYILTCNACGVGYLLSPTRLTTGLRSTGVVMCLFIFIDTSQQDGLPVAARQRPQAVFRGIGHIVSQFIFNWGDHQRDGSPSPPAYSILA
jgi:hypothetical protein